MSCHDCGRTGPALCAACISVAEALGYTADQRLTILGAPPLIDLNTT